MMWIHSMTIKMYLPYVIKINLISLIELMNIYNTNQKRIDERKKERKRERKKERNVGR